MRLLPTEVDATKTAVFQRILTSAEVMHHDDVGNTTLCAVMQQTLVAVPKTY